MSGRRMKKLRKQALKLHPEGSTLSFEVTKVDKDKTPVAGRFYYGGYRRIYQRLKKGI